MVNIGPSLHTTDILEEGMYAEEGVMTFGQSTLRQLKISSLREVMSEVMQAL